MKYQYCNLSFADLPKAD